MVPFIQLHDAETDKAFYLRTESIRRYEFESPGANVYVDDSEFPIHVKEQPKAIDDAIRGAIHWTGERAVIAQYTIANQIASQSKIAVPSGVIANGR